MVLPEPSIVRQAAQTAAVCAEHLRLPLHSRVWRGTSGDLAGHGTGASMDFQDHRPYFPGDDPRHINWQAYARTGTYTMKQFREEVRPTVDVLLDASASMFLTPQKALRVCELFHFAIECALRASARLTIHAQLAGEIILLPVAAVISQRWIELLAERLSPVPVQPKLTFPKSPSGLHVWISDLLFPGDPSPCLRSLTGARGHAIVLAPYCREEAAPDWSGSCDLWDVESGQKHDRRIGTAEMRRYKHAYEAHFAAWQEAARRTRISLARIPSESALDSALAAEAISVRAVESVHG